MFLDPFELGKLHMQDPCDAAADNQHRIVFFQVSQALTAGNASQRLDECAFFKGHVVGELVDAEVNVDFWDADVLREAAWVIVGGVQGVAGRVEASFAVAAFVAWDMVGNENAVAHFEAFDFAADFVDDACRLMTQNKRSLRHTVPFDYVAAANPACHNLKQRLILADLGNRHVLDADVMVVVVDGGQHRFHRKEDLLVRLCQLLLVRRGPLLPAECSRRGQLPSSPVWRRLGTRFAKRSCPG